GGGALRGRALDLRLLRARGARQRRAQLPVAPLRRPRRRVHPRAPRGPRRPRRYAGGRDARRAQAGGPRPRRRLLRQDGGGGAPRAGARRRSDAGVPPERPIPRGGHRRGGAARGGGGGEERPGLGATAAGRRDPLRARDRRREQPGDRRAEPGARPRQPGVRLMRTVALAPSLWFARRSRTTWGWRGLPRLFSRARGARDGWLDPAARKISLELRSDGAGDTVNLVPLVQEIAARHPGAELTVVTNHPEIPFPMCAPNVRSVDRVPPGQPRSCHLDLSPEVRYHLLCPHWLQYVLIAGLSSV